MGRDDEFNPESIELTLVSFKHPRGAIRVSDIYIGMLPRGEAMMEIYI